MAEPSEGPSAGGSDDPRSRDERNVEALEYYRRRSKAPGVAEGGSERNFYCMECDGVIPFGAAPERCPHCDAPIDERVRRYFNWVEINDPPQSDAKALLPWLALGGFIILALAGWLAYTTWR